MMERLLQIHLSPIARDHRRWQMLRALARLWWAAGIAGLALVIIDRVSGWSSPWLFLVLLTATIVGSFVVWRRFARRPLDFQAVARNIEAENPKLHALLLTAVEQTPDGETHELNYLQNRLIRQALAEDRRSQWRRRAAARLRRAQAGSIAALVLLGGVLVSLYESAPPGVSMLTRPERGVSVSPGDTSIERGSSLAVMARFDGDVPDEAVLVVRPANESERRIPLTRNLDDPVFGTSLPNVRGALTYRVEYGSESTPEFKVTTFEFPRLERADARITFPEYTGLSQKTVEDTRRVSAVEGSQLEYTFHLNKPVRSAALVTRPERGRVVGAPIRGTFPDAHPDGATSDASSPHDGGYELAADTNRPNVLTLNTVLERSGRYELVLLDDEGRTNRLPPLFVFEALSNRVPDLKFAFPKGDQRVSALEELQFQAEVFDDFGLQGYGLAYNLAGAELQLIELGDSGGPQEKKKFDHLVALEDLGAQPDQLLSYYLWADDIGPDGQRRRTVSDIYFAEVRPFEEIFREAQSQDGAQQQQQQQGQQGQNRAEQLAELQKQIITATWNLQRRETGEAVSTAFKEDAGTVEESQQSALQQVRNRMEQNDDPRSRALLETVKNEMERAARHLGEAAGSNSVEPLSPALAAEQSAYQALLQLATREIQVAQGQSGQRGQSGRGARAQQQLDQLDLRQSRNRYETESQAAMPMDERQREQLQAFNRLKELAQRQQDVNERLRELQSALQEAQTEREREELREQLKRLQEEQRQMLADVDELRQRMQRPENQAEMAEARQQLDQTRQDVQRAAEAMDRGEVAQALSSGTRAQREMEQLREDFRRESSSQFAEDMREMRGEARELAERQGEIGRRLDELDAATQRKTLTDSDERKELAANLDEQNRRLGELMDHATDITQKAETVEPLLSRQLYDTLRRAAQDDARNLEEMRDELLMEGRMYRNVFERLQSAQQESERPVGVAADLLREGRSAEAGNLERRARRSIDQLREGIEQAANSVLGDDTEALRFARSELDELSRQIERELRQARDQANTNRAVAGAGDLTRQGEPSSEPQEGAGRSGQQQQASARGGSGEPSDENQQPSGQERQRGEGGGEGQQLASADQPGGGRGGRDGEERQGEAGGNGDEGSEGQDLASANQRGGGSGGRGEREEDSERAGGREAGGQRGGQRGGGGDFLDRFGGGAEDFLGGPITGPGYSGWSDRLRDVEELLDDPDLRAEAARIRDRARATRLDLRRHAREPQWDLVRLEIAEPLVELRNRVAEELARRQSSDAIVPIDRDPVPARYSELVRRYYEKLGRSETGDGGGVSR